MPQVLTVSCKLEVTPSQVEKLDAVLRAFASCCEYVNKNTNQKLTNQIAVQSLIYKEARDYSGMSAQMTIHAIRRVCANRKTAKQQNRPVKGFAPTSATYDARTFTFREKDWTVSLTMVKGREKFRLHIGNYQRHLLAGTNPKSAVLAKRKDGTYYLQIQLESEPPQPEKTLQVLGVDLGRTDICVTSEGEKFNGEQITQVRDRYARVRASLQQRASKGTRSSRRRCRQLLQRLSGRERRFQTQVNHAVSYRLIQHAKKTSQTIALENLTGIRERTNQQPRSQTQRRRSNSWAFYQLRQFLTYKAVKFGVNLVFVDPRYTSQTCHKCLHIHPVRGESYRSGKKFRCGHCGWIGDADENAAKNISSLGLILDQPRGSGLACSLEQHVLGLLKSPTERVSRSGKFKYR
ncbi:RNA-guided endonuclease InsQ/TnpB family protein [Aerosakkonema funiforme]|uniref:RNA-guided endonuclease InsQ/TnpB family protein n=1 Tax=Aerosakkonema funiforme TaxID=1246630 RepID=UPI0035B8FF58